MAMNQAGLEGEAYNAIWNYLSSNGFVHSTGNADDRDFNDTMVRAMAKGVAAIVPHIVANSELVPVTTDTGTAGAGIITGKVK